MLLSAALIVKNEEKFLGTCLRSLKGLADEVVVVDTGSTDRTADIAIAEGARLYHRPWTGDFSAARNEAIKLARGDWILYIDADERVSGGDPELVRAQLRAARYIGYRVQLRPRPGFTPYWEMRLFRNHPQIRFRGIIHENIWPALNERQAQSGGRIGHTELVLDHDGYEGDQGAKHLRNQPLLEQSLAADPSRVYSQCHLASIREALGDAAGAEQAWAEAMRLVRSKQTRQPEDVLPFLHEIERGLATDDSPGPLGLLDEALALFPGQLQLLWLRARALIAAGRPAQATGVLEELVRLGQSGEFDKSWAYDLRLFGVLAYELLAACYFGEGLYVDALRYFELAAAAEPANLEYRVKAALCGRLLGGRLLGGRLLAAPAASGLGRETLGLQGGQRFENLLGRRGREVERLPDELGDLRRGQAPVAQLQDQVGRRVQVMNAGPIRLVDDETVLRLVDLETVALPGRRHRRLLWHGANLGPTTRPAKHHARWRGESGLRGGR